MIVKCQRSDDESGTSDGWLEVGRDYIVLAIHFGRSGPFFRLFIPHEPDYPPLFDGFDFVLVDGDIPPDWDVSQGKSGNYNLGPSAWGFDFWDRLFDGHDDTDRLYESERDKIVNRYLRPEGLDSDIA